jgi:hypothetical protein
MERKTRRERSRLLKKTKHQRRQHRQKRRTMRRKQGGGQVMPLYCNAPVCAPFFK